MAIVTGCRFFRWNYRRRDDPNRHLVRQISPGNIAQSFGWASLDTLGFSIAEETLGCLVRVRIKRHHLPGTGLLAHLATNALLGIDHAGIGGRFDDNRVIRAGISTGDRMGTLLT